MDEDKQLARLYDYTKFHIGIYLSSAGAIAALLGTEKTDLFLSELVAPNKTAFYFALFFMTLAGMCGGMVASSTIECASFTGFWNEKHGPQVFPRLVMYGRKWAMLEHAFFWVSLLILGYAVAIGFANPKLPASEAARPKAAVKSHMPQYSLSLEPPATK